MRRFGILLAVSFLAAQAFSEVHFTARSYAEAVKTASDQHKPVLIDFMTDWCRWCDTLDHRTYTDERVAALLNSKCVPVKIDAEKGEGVGLAKRFAVQGYPTILLVNAEGNEIDRVVGYLPADQFLKTMDDYLSGRNTIGALLDQARKDSQNVDLDYQLAIKYQERNSPADAAGYFKKVLALDPQNTKGHNPEAQFAVAVQQLKGEKDPSGLETYVKRDPASPQAAQASTVLMTYYLKAKKGPEARAAFERYMGVHPADANMMNEYAWDCFKSNVNLDHAAEVAEKAVALSSTDGEKAACLDTQASVEFARSHKDRAVALEQQALDLLKNATDKERKPYEETLAKFKGAPAAAEK